MRILIVDDDRVVSHLLTGRLRAKGYEVVNAFDAMQAMMAAMRSQPDAIVLDINMPGGTGIEALKRLKASSKTALIPVIVVSGTTDPQTPATVKTLGAAEFLPKPVDVDQLLRTLSRLLGTAHEGS